jgi:hypothetical protein
MSDPILLRGIERILIVAGSIAFGYLGYRLFIFGISDGLSRIKAQSKIFTLTFSGTAPGLFFMFCGAAILVSSIVFGGANRETVNNPKELLQAINKSTQLEIQIALDGHKDAILDEIRTIKLSSDKSASSVANPTNTNQNSVKKDQRE